MFPAMSLIITRILMIALSLSPFTTQMFPLIPSWGSSKMLSLQSAPQ